MMTVNEVSKLTGVSIRALQYYDKIGLLSPAGYTESGYRLYDDAALEMLQQILLFRELEFPLKEIRKIISSPDFDKKKALEEQITLLTMKKEHLENLIGFAREIQMKGETTMDFSVFDTQKIDEYAKQAKQRWGKTDAYKESVQKAAGRSKEEEKAVMENFMQIFADFGKLKDTDPRSADARSQVKILQDYITEHFYQCTDEILDGLGQMYAAGGEFTENIDRAGGAGTAQFTAEAIRIYCGK
ncbi:MAG: MerR family transcriptional regulator [Lachnospiraceae bacterium]|nr:MerR family transcriptional regulator [Lachnospiraceae bacterium]